MMNYVIGLYLRLSQEDRDTDGCVLDESSSITGQREILQDFIRTHEEFATAHTIEFCDDGYSGTNFDRPGIKNLIEAAKAGVIQCIIVKDFSRFGRNYIEVGNYLEQVFPFLGIRFISVNDGFDSSKGFGAVGNIDVAFKNLLYDLYSKDLSEKAISGRNSKAQQGEYLAAYAPYGYRKVNCDGSKRIVIDEEAAPVVARIFEMADNGISKSEIARTLNNENIPSPVMLRIQRGENIAWRIAGGQAYWFGATITMILKDKRYLGYFEYGKTKPIRVGSKKRIYLPKEEWITIPNHHEAIISQELFDRVQAKGSSKSEVKRKKTEREPSALSGKLRCAVCKHALTAKKLKSGVFYFCKTKNQLSECKCFKGRITESELETKLLSVIASITEVLGMSPYLPKDQQKVNLLEKQKQLKELQTGIDRLMLSKIISYEQYVDGTIDQAAFLAVREKVAAEVEKLKHQAQKIEQEIQAAHEAMLSKESGIHEALTEQSLSTTLKKEWIDVLIDTIYLNKDGSVQIEWSFGDLFDTDAMQIEYEVSA